MQVELTTQSAEAYDRLRSGEMTPAMAAEYLKAGQIVLRGFMETLRELYPGPDLAQRLLNEFQADLPEANPDSLSRKIRNWLTGQNRPASREDVFHIAFALELGETGANRLLGLCTEYGIHYREMREVVYAWFLRAGRRYREARAFFDALPPVPQPDALPPDLGSRLTQELHGLFQRVQTEEGLRDFCLENLERFGALHLRAYAYFQKYMDLLVHPAAVDGGKEPDYSMEAVMEQYLSLHMPSQRSRRNWSVVQKLIKHNWPNATALKNIRLRKEDVPRKLLLLLYVITENVTDGAYSELDEDYITAQEWLEDHWWSLNAILTDCGMPLLDLRNATDWLVLYAITAQDEPMSERMEQVIEHMFADYGECPDEPEE